MLNVRRILGHGSCIYHVSGELWPNSPALDDHTQGQFVHLLRRCAAFSGVELFTYCIEPGGYSALLRVAPEQARVDDETLVDRVRTLYGDEFIPALGMDSAGVEKALRTKAKYADELRRVLTSRMGDISLLMRIFCQRATLWFNKHMARIGPLWKAPFRSVLVEDHPAVRSLVGVYIDLAPVRAGLASRPEDYPWCGFGTFARGDDDALEALARLVDEDMAEPAALGRYRTLMQLWGPYPDPSGAALRAGGALPLPAVPNLFAVRQPAMERGGAVGRPEFIGDPLASSGFQRRRIPAGGFTALESPVQVTHLRQPAFGRGRPKGSTSRLAEPAAEADQ